VSFIDTHRALYGVGSMCAQWPIAPSLITSTRRARSTPHACRRGCGAIAHEAGDQPRVRSEFSTSTARKVWRQLGREDFKAARCTVER
jgi:hypothetical protein